MTIPCTPEPRHQIRWANANSLYLCTCGSAFTTEASAEEHIVLYLTLATGGTK